MLCAEILWSSMRQALPPGERSRLLCCLMHKVVPTGAPSPRHHGRPTLTAGSMCEGQPEMRAGEPSLHVSRPPHQPSPAPHPPPHLPSPRLPPAASTYSMLRSSKTSKAGWQAAWQQRCIHFARSHVGMALQVSGAGWLPPCCCASKGARGLDSRGPAAPHHQPHCTTTAAAARAQAYQDALLDSEALHRVCIAAAADFRRVWARYGGRHAGRNLGKALKHLNTGGWAPVWSQRGRRLPGSAVCCARSCLGGPR